MVEKWNTYRSIRKYETRGVEEMIIREVLSAALLAPSSRGFRPWQFVVVQDEALREALSKAKAPGAGFLREAPVVVVVLADPQQSDVWVEDCSIAAYTIQVRARELGLGTCWVQIRMRTDAQGVPSEDRVKEILGIPESFSVGAILALGHPAETKAPYTEEDLDWNKIHWDKW